MIGVAVIHFLVFHIYSFFDFIEKYFLQNDMRQELNISVIIKKTILILYQVIFFSFIYQRQIYTNKEDLFF